MNKNLHEELIAAGASPEEAAELASFAGRLHDLPTPLPIPQRRFVGWQLTAGLAATAAVFFTVGGAAVAAAQTVMPGSILYPIKRASERIMVTTSPAFADTVMMRRADEIDTLASRRGSERVILSDVAEYDREIKAARADQPTKDYCIRHLEHAAAETSGSEQAAIDEALSRMRYD